MSTKLAKKYLFLGLFLASATVGTAILGTMYTHQLEKTEPEKMILWPALLGVLLGLGALFCLVLSLLAYLNRNKTR